MGADGTWNTTNTPMGAQNGTLTLTTNGGELGGMMSGPQGEMAIENGTVDGDTLAEALHHQSNAHDIRVFSKRRWRLHCWQVKLGAFGEAEFQALKRAKLTLGRVLWWDKEIDELR